MPCTPDQKYIFKDEEFYTVFCDVCQCWAKIYKFRSCEERLSSLEEQGIDIFKEVREADRMASYQIGQTNTINTPKKQIENPKKQTEKSKSPKTSRRGR